MRVSPSKSTMGKLNKGVNSKVEAGNAKKKVTADARAAAKAEADERATAADWARGSNTHGKQKADSLEEKRAAMDKKKADKAAAEAADAEDMAGVKVARKPRRKIESTLPPWEQALVDGAKKKP